jgi:hypothetical protein
VHLLFRIRIHNLKLRIRIRIRILQKVSDPYGSGFGSGSTTLVLVVTNWFAPNLLYFGTGTLSEYGTKPSFSGLEYVKGCVFVDYTYWQCFGSASTFCGSESSFFNECGSGSETLPTGISWTSGQGWGAVEPEAQVQVWLRLWTFSLDDIF